MNHKIANILKGYIDALDWADKTSGLVQTANIRKDEGEGKVDKSFPISCDVTYDECIAKGKYQDLCPDSSKKSVMFFEDQGGVELDYYEDKKVHYRTKLRLVVWLNLKLIEDVACDSDVADCGVSGDYVKDVIGVIPYVGFDSGGFYGIQIEPPSQAERSVDIFGRYTFNEPQTQYLMWPYDYFALDFDITFIVPCT